MGVPQSQVGGYPIMGYPSSQVRMGYPQPGQDGVHPPPARVGVPHSQDRMGYPLARDGVPPGIGQQRSPCLLRSHRRTVLFLV